MEIAATMLSLKKREKFGNKKLKETEATIDIPIYKMKIL